MHDMEAMISLEIKKEIADRYFGFRKMIEDDSRDYRQHIQEAYRQLENEVGFDLIRLYMLLRREPLIHDFFRLTGLRDAVFLEPYLLDSQPIRQRLFQGLHIHGFTRRSRFRNAFIDVYNRLQTGTTGYAQTLKRLTEEGRAIADEIEVFYRKNDLPSVMDFLRRLDSGSLESSPMNANVAPLRDHYLEDKLRITAPASAETLLPAFVALPEFKSCKSGLEDLIDSAYAAQAQPEALEFAS